MNCNYYNDSNTSDIIMIMVMMMIDDDESLSFSAIDVAAKSRK